MNFGGTSAAAPAAAAAVAAATTPTGPSGPSGLSTEFTADNAVRMPTYNSPAQLEAAKLARQSLMAKSGRASTQLVAGPGTSTYQNSFLGGSL